MSQDSDIPVPENVILQTTNYGMFKFDKLNRAIRPDKLDRLHDSVQAKNLLHLFPIVVTRDYIVVDGQHRLKVAEALGTPIYYIVSSQMRIEDAARVNANVTTWKSVDYLEHWCKAGVDDYLWFKEFWTAHSFLTFSTALRLFTVGNPMLSFRDVSPAYVFNNGGLKAGNLAFANTVANMARDFGRWVSFWKEFKFIVALIHLAENPEYDHHRMLQKMEYLSARLVKCGDIRDYMKVFEQLYNHKATASNRVRFLLTSEMDKTRNSRKKSAD